MGEPNLFQIFISHLNKLGIRYMVTGAVAAIVYGEPRLTHDIDLVIELKTEDTGKMIESFSPKEFYCPPEEYIQLEMKRTSRGHFNIIHFETGFKADCYLMGQDELHHWGMLNRKEFIVEGESIWVAPPEYVILRKLEYYREGKSQKHLLDVANMLRISSPQIDFPLLQEKIRNCGLEREWAEVKKLLEE
jgi:hypothetical protein